MLFGKALIMKNYEIAPLGKKVHSPFTNCCLNKLKEGRWCDKKSVTFLRGPDV